LEHEVAAARQYYEKGNEARRRGQWHEAINNYIRAAELDPDSPAVEAKRMLDDILAYYNKDMYNP
jgi:outer membrane protein assembly factor BamD (BamD/ComL family)